MHTENYNYFDGKTECHGFLAYEQGGQPKPVVLVVHDWSGRNPYAEQRARDLAELGYVAFAVDMYGEGRRGSSVDDKLALMGPLMNDRDALLQRIEVAVQAVIGLPQVDSSRMAVIGYCFGGLVGLDLARSGADIKAVVLFHGLLQAPPQPRCVKVKAKVLALHGYDDPMVPPSALTDFANEMTDKKVDWQLHSYGGVSHAFTNPEANDTTLGTIYNETAAKRSWESCKDFLAASLAG